MARILLAAMPAVGHVSPLLPLTATLSSRGHDVRFYTGRAFQERVETAGGRFEAMRSPIDPGDGPLEDHIPGLRGREGLDGMKHAIKHFFVDSGVGQVADLRRIQAEWPADVIVNDSSFVGAGWFHEDGGPVWAALSPLPLMLSSPDVAPFGPGFRYLPGPLGRARNAVLQQLVKRVVMRDVLRYTTTVRAGLGLPARSGLIFDGALSPYLYLQSGVPSLEYPRSGLAPQVHFVGSMQPAKPYPAYEPPPWWGDVVRGDRPVVHVTQGTVSTDPTLLLRPTLRALAGEDALVVATTGGPDVATLGPLPDNARAADFIPHANLLPHVTLMVTNGGFGGVQVALGHGIPLVVAGSTEEKPEVANRVEFAGAGINLRTGRPSDGAIRGAVRRLLAEPSFGKRAFAIADDLAQHDGPREAAELVERLTATRQPVLR
jgi:UDP:flavonoid glycosyltransferase YjiC (YdhE family)